jgi:hypothetical protein
MLVKFFKAYGVKKKQEIPSPELQPVLKTSSLNESLGGGESNEKKETLDLNLLDDPVEEDGDLATTEAKDVDEDLDYDELAERAAIFANFLKDDIAELFEDRVSMY